MQNYGDKNIYNICIDDNDDIWFIVYDWYINTLSHHSNQRPHKLLKFTQSTGILTDYYTFDNNLPEFGNGGSQASSAAGVGWGLPPSVDSDISQSSGDYNVRTSFVTMTGNTMFIGNGGGSGSPNAVHLTNYRGKILNI